MNRTFDRALLRFAVLGALLVALGLAACGRKAGLDPPPAAAAVPAGETAAPSRDMLGRDLVGTDSEGKPVAAATAAVPQRKHFFLDWLID